MTGAPQVLQLPKTTRQPQSQATRCSARRAEQRAWELQLDLAARPLDGVERDAAARLDVLAHRALEAREIAGGDALDDVPVLRDEVRVPFGVNLAVMRTFFMFTPRFRVTR